MLWYLKKNCFWNFTTRFIHKWYSEYNDDMFRSLCTYHAHSSNQFLRKEGATVTITRDNALWTIPKLRATSSKDKQE
jgi:hypothetical protein